MPEGIKSNKSLYGDYVKLIREVGMEENCKELQKAWTVCIDEASHGRWNIIKTSATLW